MPGTVSRSADFAWMLEARAHGSRATSARPRYSGWCNQAVTSPAYSQHSCLGLCNVARAGLLSPRASEPPIEPSTGGPLIQADRWGLARQGLPMLAAIQQHVLQRVSNLSRTPQEPYVIATGEHTAPSPKDPIHRSGDSRRDRVHSPSQRTVVVSLDDRVEVVSQDRVVNDPEAPAFASNGKALTNLFNERVASQRGDPVPDAHGDQPRSRTRDALPANVVDDWPPRRLPAGSPTRAPVPRSAATSDQGVSPAHASPKMRSAS